MYRIHCLNPISKVGLNHLPENYSLTDSAAEADGILVRSAVMHDMEMPESLLAVARAGAGYNNIPLEKCAQKGIVVFNTPGANANGVKEIIIAAMLLASRDIVGGIEWVKENQSDPAIAKATEKAKKAFAGTEIMGKTLGVIGLGAIGAMVANVAEQLGMTVMGYDPFLSVDAAWKLSHSVKHVTDVNEIYSNCDFITIHVPAMDSTKGMIGKEAIALMKPNAVILNFARDVLCDEQAAVEALAEGRIRRYVSDFPTPVTSGKPGCIVIPHLGASTEESEDNCAVMAVKELQDYLENGSIVNSVNYPRCEVGPCRTASRVAVLHRNVAGMLTAITTCAADAGINIAEVVNKSRDEVAYTLIDLDQKATAQMVESLNAIPGVFRVRVIQ
ncbi:MAG: phosphoglycerate dehydrogenase [Lachnospiraceae bacterium]|nr:phosphoglycerate dehydrogenase [Lachnospiraceae bacterium]